MSQEWGHAPPPVMTAEDPRLEDSVDDVPEDESVNAETCAEYFQECERNRGLLQSIRVVVPVRPADGTNNRLAQKLSIWYGEGTPWSHLNDHMGGFIEATRANIAYQFMQDKTKPKFLLMIDNDMEPPLSLPYMLGRHDQPAVGAPAMSVSPKYGPQLCFTVMDEEGNYRFPTLKARQKIPTTGLKEVGHVGTGALMIRRDVLEAFSFSMRCRECDFEVPYEEIAKCDTFGDMAEASVCPTCSTAKHMYEDIPFFVPLKWRMLGMRAGQICLGEDISFCNQIRAKGFKQYVDLEAHCGHRKMMGLSWDEDFREPTLSAENWVIPAYGKRILSL